MFERIVVARKAEQKAKERKEALIVKGHERGMTLRELGEAAGMSSPGVLYLLRRKGVIE